MEIYIYNLRMHFVNSFCIFILLGCNWRKIIMYMVHSIVRNRCLNSEQKTNEQLKIKYYKLYTNRKQVEQSAVIILPGSLIWSTVSLKKGRSAPDGPIFD